MTKKGGFMGTRLTSEEGVVALFDSTEGVAFGPVFEDEREAQEFLTWLREERDIEDPRIVTNQRLMELATTWWAQTEDVQC